MTVLMVIISTVISNPNLGSYIWQCVPLEDIHISNVAGNGKGYCLQPTVQSGIEINAPVPEFYSVELHKVWRSGLGYIHIDRQTPIFSR